MNNLFSEEIKDIESQLNKLSIQKNCLSVLCLIAEENAPSKSELDPILHRFNKPIIGGIFPELIVQSKRVKKGCLLIPLQFELETVLIQDTNNINDAFKTFKTTSNQIKESIFVFVDAFSDNKETFIHSLYNFFGITVNYIGAGAGFMTFENKPSIIHNSGLTSNSAVIGKSNFKMSIGVAHGWNTISDPIKVTEAIGNVIVSLDWEPALEVYKRIVSQYSNLQFTESNFFDICKSFPIGMVKLDSEMVMRDTYKIEESKIYILDNIPQGEYISIMNGNLDSLLEGARKAKIQSDNQMEENISIQNFCVDCISRVYFMDHQFNQELEILSPKNDIFGVLSLGEIANHGDTFLEIFNKTVVLAQWNMNK